MAAKLKVKNILLVALTAMFLCFGVYPALAITNVPANVTQQSPTDDSWDGDGNIDFNCTVAWPPGLWATQLSLNITNVTLWGDFVTAGTFVNNATNTTAITNLTAYNFTRISNLPTRNYTWYCIVSNRTGADDTIDNATRLNFSVKVSTNPPSVRAFYPTASFQFNYTDPSLAPATISVNVSHLFWNLSNVNATGGDVWYYMGSGPSLGSGVAQGQISANTSIKVYNTSGLLISNYTGLFNFTIVPNFTNIWLSPGPHSIVFCANDSGSSASDRAAGAKRNCTAPIDFIIKVVNVTQIMDLVNGLAPVTMNITLENGTHSPGMDPTAFNYTIRMNTTNMTAYQAPFAFQIVGVQINETLMAKMNNTNMNITATPLTRANLRQGLGGNLTDFIWPDVSSMAPTASFYKYGIIELTNSSVDNIYFYFNGTDITNPSAYRLQQCTYQPNYTTYSTAIGSNGCWQNITEAGNPRAKIFLYIPRFSGGGNANDTAPPYTTNITPATNGTWHNANFAFNITVQDAGGENATGVNASQVYYRWEAQNSSWLNGSWVQMSNMTSTMWNATFGISGLADGRYLLRTNVSDNSLNNNTNTSWVRTIYIDITSPVPSTMTLTKSGTIYTGDSLTAADFSTCGCNSDNSQGFGGTCSASFDSSVLTTSTAGSKSVACCTAIDTVGNTASATCAYTVYDHSTPSTGGGGAGGGGASTVVAGDLEAGKTATIKLDGSTPLKEAVIEVGLNKITDAQIAVSASTSLPSSAGSAPSGTVYRYLDVKTSGAQFVDTNIVKATLSFKVEKGWLAEKGISQENIVLARFKDNKWTELKTSVSSSDSTYVFYKAETAGFSVFAITTKAPAAAPPAAPVKEKVAEVVKEAAGVPEAIKAIAAKPSAGTWIAVVVILALIGVAVYYFTYYGKKKKKRWA